MRENTPIPEVYWYTLRKPKITKLASDLVLDVAIIGGGMTGLMCAQKLKRNNKNLKIAILESSFCGGGASGKSSGFITPDSELNLSDLIKQYGKEDGKKLWEFVKGGVRSIRKTIEQINIKCDFVEQDSFFIANTDAGYKKVVQEYTAQQECGYDATLYDAHTLKNSIGSSGYKGAVRTTETFGIISYLYCQDLKEALQREGVLVFEETPVLELTAAGIKINGYTVTAEKVVVCTDHLLPDFGIGKESVYHAQTFLGLSKPLSPETIKSIFPDKPGMIWDTDLIYQYFRIVEGNRLLLGASSLVYTYARSQTPFSSLILKKMKSYMKKKFPQVSIEFEYFWPGLIGVSKDFLPIAGKDPVFKNVYFAGAAAGLPWAAAVGEYIADKIIHTRDDFDRMFAVDRIVPLGKQGNVVLSKPVSFAINHGIKKYFN